MFVAVAEICFDIGKFGQGIVLCISKVLADGRDMCGIDRQDAAGISENVFTAIREIRECSRWRAVGIRG